MSHRQVSQPMSNRETDAYVHPVLAGVRARQEKVVFVTCEDEDLISSTVRPLLGKQVALNVTSTSVTLSLDDAIPDNGSGPLIEDAAAPTAVAPSSVQPAR